MVNYKKIFGVLGLGAGLALSGSASAATLHLKNLGAVPLPTSFSDAVTNGYNFVFDSWYNDGSGWVGGQVDLTRSIISMSCRLQLAGTIYEDTVNNVVRIAVTHGDSTQTPPSGSNSSLCSSVALEFNNSYTHSGFPSATAGYWVASFPVSSLPTSDDTSVLSDNFYDVQVDTPLFGYCSTTYGGSGGDIEVDYSNNGSGAPGSFSFDGDINAPNGSACAVIGELFSVEGSVSVNGSPTNLDQILYISQ